MYSIKCMLLFSKGSTCVHVQHTRTKKASFSDRDFFFQALQLSDGDNWCWSAGDTNSITWYYYGADTVQAGLTKA